jgi:hypothetical protein
MGREILSSRESEDYTEGDLTNWIHQLNQYRKDLETFSSSDLIDDDNESSIIRLIRVDTTERKRTSSSKSRISSYAQFNSEEEFCALSEDGLVAAASGLQRREHIAFMGSSRYSIGSPWIRFRIEKLTGGAILFGVIPFSHADPTTIFTSPNGVYGWYAGSVAVKNNAFEEQDTQEYLREGDHITLTLNCYSREIFFRHHRTERLLRLQVDPQKCPLSWKVVVVLYNNGDRVRIF